MRSILFITAAALLIGAAPREKTADAQRHRRPVAGERVEDDSRRRSDGDRPRQRRPRGRAARARLRAGPRRQHQGAGARQILGRRDRLSRPGQLCRAMGIERKRQAVAQGRHRQAAGGIYAAAQGADDHAARITRCLCAGRGLRRWLAGRLQLPGRAGPTSPIATRASASAGTCRPTRERAASSMR